MHFYSPAFLFSGKEKSCWYTIREINRLPATIQTVSLQQAGYRRTNGFTAHFRAAAAARTLPTGSSAIARRAIASEPICKKSQIGERRRKMIQTLLLNRKHPDCPQS